MRRHTVLGIGNALLCDEGLGVRAAELVREGAPAGTRILAVGALGPELLPEVEGASRLLVIDCVDAGRPPGTVVRLDDLGRLGDGPSLSMHEFGLRDLLAMAALHGRVPEEVVVLGVQPARVSPALGLSAEVTAALPRLVREALAVLAGWAGVGPSAPSP